VRTSTRNVSSIADSKLPMDVNLNASYDSFRCPETETQSVDNNDATQDCGQNDAAGQLAAVGHELPQFHVRGPLFHGGRKHNPPDPLLLSPGVDGVRSDDISNPDCPRTKVREACDPLVDFSAVPRTTTGPGRSGRGTSRCRQWCRAESWKGSCSAGRPCSLPAARGREHQAGVPGPACTTTNSHRQWARARSRLEPPALDPVRKSAS
jgi:hypothetical protein